MTDTPSKPASKPSGQAVAVALKYDLASKDVPHVVAIGKGHVAEKIIEAAKAADVPIEQNEPLARSLAQLEIDQAIPPQLYKAVAAVLGFLMKQRKLRA